MLDTTRERNVMRRYLSEAPQQFSILPGLHTFYTFVLESNIESACGQTHSVTTDTARMNVSNEMCIALRQWYVQ